MLIKCVNVINILSVVDLLFGSLAITNSEGVLGSPAPEKLMADTRNSYSIPSTTSFTSYCLPRR